MTECEEILTERWVRSGYPLELVETLLKKYREPQRHYHAATHLRHMFDILDQEAGDVPERAVLELAIWYHDREYDPRSKSNELTSALQFLGDAARLALTQADRARVVELILLSRHHGPGDDALAQLFCDLDLAILGEPSDVYNRYAESIRQEYRHVPESMYRWGRRQVLQRFLQRPRLFHRLVQREEAGRSNLSSELDRLRGGHAPLGGLPKALGLVALGCAGLAVPVTAVRVLVLAWWALFAVAACASRASLRLLEANVRKAPVLFPDEPRRRKVWSALSDLYLDNEVDHEGLATSLRTSGYGRQDLAYILQFEVAPVVAANLGFGVYPVCGEWAGFDEDWLRTRILWRAYSCPWPTAGWFTTRFVQDDFEKAWSASV